MFRSIGSVTVLALLMVGCGGGDGSSPPPVGYTVGGTVTGLAGLGLVLASDFGGDLAVSASGSFTFGTRIPAGSTFRVTVKNQPTSSPAQFCEVANGTGTIAAATVVNVTVTCGTGFAVNVTVAGLVGSGLTLTVCTPPRGGGPGGGGRPRCNDPQQISADGAFTMGPVIPLDYLGVPYVVIVQQPTSPAQSCVFSSANNARITVSCAGFSYVVNATDNTLSPYGVDARTGALAVIGAPIDTGVSPYATFGLKYDNNRYVFVGNRGSNDVSVFAVNGKTGALTAVPGSPYPAGTDPQAMALANDGAYILYVANAGSDDVYAYNVNSNGSLNSLFGPGLSKIATGRYPTSIAIGGQSVVGLPAFSPFVFVANHGGSNDISAFRFDLTPVPGSPFPAGGNPLSLAVGARGTFLYSANPDAAHPSISGFRIDPTTGVPSPLSGSPFPLPVSHYIATDQTGSYLYVTSGASVVGYAIDAQTGALTALPGFPVAVGPNAYSIAIDTFNQFLYVANDGGANIAGFRLDASTGALTSIPNSPFPTGNHPEFIATF